MDVKELLQIFAGVFNPSSTGYPLFSPDLSTAFFEKSAGKMSFFHTLSVFSTQLIPTPPETCG